MKRDYYRKVDMDIKRSVIWTLIDSSNLPGC